MTQTDVAHLLGTTQSAIARLEKDTAGSMSLHRYVDYALACGKLPFRVELASIETLRRFTLACPDQEATVETVRAWERAQSQSLDEVVTPLANVQHRTAQRDSLENSLPVDLTSTGKVGSSRDSTVHSADKDVHAVGKAQNSEVVVPTGLPADLVEEARSLGQRADPDRVRSVILRLCSQRPLGGAEVAAVLNRHDAYVLGSYLRPMVREGLLQYTHPENPRHPLQAYRAICRAPSAPHTGPRESPE